MTLSPMEPNVSDYFCHGAQMHPGLQDDREAPEHNTRESHFLTASHASGQSFSIGGRDPAFRVNRSVNRVFGAVKLPGV
jgi:hypothetical protein